MNNEKNIELSAIDLLSIDDSKEELVTLEQIEMREEQSCACLCYYQEK